MGGPAVRDPRRLRGHDAGSLSLESVLVLPVIAVLVIGLLSAVGVVRDVLVLHEAARVGARVAATTADNDQVARAVRAAAPELPGPQLSISPSARVSGQVVTVTVRHDRRLGQRLWRLHARASARVEPTVGQPGGTHPWWGDPPPATGPRPPFETGGPVHAPGVP
jgi:hypothetical protein